MSLKVHKNIASLVPYSPGKPLDELERELGISNAVKLASNENSLGPSPKAQAVLVEQVGQLNVYPDGGAHYLRRALAERWKVDPAQIVVGNGSDEVISLLVKAFVEPGEEAVMADDTFVMYKLAVQGGHGVSIEVPLKDWRHDLPSMARAITDKTRLVFVCNPNNPTGTMVSKDEVDAFMEAVPDDVIVVFDEAYYEYVRSNEYPESLQYVKQNRPVVVLRTFSKIYGLAGLRVGYGISTLEIMDFVNRVRPPFNSNSLAQAAALAALDVFKGYNVVVVTHEAGFREPGKIEMGDETVAEIKKRGGKVLTTVHAFGGVATAVWKKFNTLESGMLIANVLRMFGQGMKVTVEITIMAADAGVLPMDGDVISIAGTGKGLDTAIVVKPAHSRELFDLYVKEIIAKPTKR